MTDKTIPIASKNDFFASLVNKLQQKAVEDVDNLSASSDPNEGQLAVDVGQTDDKLVIVATIAGAKPEDVSVAINGDLLTIRGKREADVTIKKDDYFYRECYWGNFSRTIVLPMDVLNDDAQATFKNGVLTIIIPKESDKKNVPIKVIED